MGMFLFKLVIFSSVLHYAANAMVIDSEESGSSEDGKVEESERLKRHRQPGYFDYLHYLIDKHAHCADEHLQAHKPPYGVYKPYEMYVLPDGTSMDSAELSDKFQGHIEQEPNIYPDYRSQPLGYPLVNPSPNIYPTLRLSQGNYSPIRPFIENNGHLVPYPAAGDLVQEPICADNRCRVKLKPKLRYKSQERRGGHKDTEDANPRKCPCAQSKKDGNRMQSGTKLENSTTNISTVNQLMINQSSKHNTTHVIVINLGANNCSCSNSSVESHNGGGRDPTNYGSDPIGVLAKHSAGSTTTSVGGTSTSTAKAFDAVSRADYSLHSDAAKVVVTGPLLSSGPDIISGNATRPAVDGATTSTASTAAFDAVSRNDSFTHSNPSKPFPMLPFLPSEPSEILVNSTRPAVADATTSRARAFDLDSRTDSSPHSDSAEVFATGSLLLSDPSVIPDNTTSPADTKVPTLTASSITKPTPTASPATPSSGRDSTSDDSSAAELKPSSDPDSTFVLGSSLTITPDSVAASTSAPTSVSGTGSTSTTAPDSLITSATNTTLGTASVSNSVSASAYTLTLASANASTPDSVIGGRSDSATTSSWTSAIGSTLSSHPTTASVRSSPTSVLPDSPSTLAPSSVFKSAPPANTIPSSASTSITRLPSGLAPASSAHSGTTVKTSPASFVTDEVLISARSTSTVTSSPSNSVADSATASASFPAQGPNSKATVVFTGTNSSPPSRFVDSDTSDIHIKSKSDPDSDSIVLGVALTKSSGSNSTRVASASVTAASVSSSTTATHNGSSVTITTPSSSVSTSGIGLTNVPLVVEINRTISDAASSSVLVSKSSSTAGLVTTSDPGSSLPLATKPPQTSTATSSSTAGLVTTSDPGPSVPLVSSLSPTSAEGSDSAIDTVSVATATLPDTLISTSSTTITSSNARDSSADTSSFRAMDPIPQPATAANTSAAFESDSISSSPPLHTDITLAPKKNGSLTPGSSTSSGFSSTSAAGSTSVSTSHSSSSIATTSGFNSSSSSNIPANPVTGSSSPNITGSAPTAGSASVSHSTSSIVTGSSSAVITGPATAFGSEASSSGSSSSTSSTITSTSTIVSVSNAAAGTSSVSGPNLTLSSATATSTGPSSSESFSTTDNGISGARESSVQIDITKSTTSDSDSTESVRASSVAVGSSSTARKTSAADSSSAIVANNAEASPSFTSNFTSSGVTSIPGTTPVPTLSIVPASTHFFNARISSDSLQVQAFPATSTAAVNLTDSSASLESTTSHSSISSSASATHSNAHSSSRTSRIQDDSDQIFNEFDENQDSFVLSNNQNLPMVKDSSNSSISRVEADQNRPMAKDSSNSRTFRIQDHQNRPTAKESSNSRTFRIQDDQNRPMAKDSSNSRTFRIQDNQDHPMAKDSSTLRTSRIQDDSDQILNEFDEKQDSFVLSSDRTRPNAKNSSNSRTFRIQDDSDQIFNEFDEKPDSFVLSNDKIQDDSDQIFNKFDEKQDSLELLNDQNRPTAKDSSNSRTFRIQDDSDQIFNQSKEEQDSFVLLNRDKNRPTTKDSSNSGTFKIQDGSDQIFNQFDEKQESFVLSNDQNLPMPKGSTNSDPENINLVKFLGNMEKIKTQPESSEEIDFETKTSTIKDTDSQTRHNHREFLDHNSKSRQKSKSQETLTGQEHRTFSVDMRAGQKSRTAQNTVTHPNKFSESVPDHIVALSGPADDLSIDDIRELEKVTLDHKDTGIKQRQDDDSTKKPLDFVIENPQEKIEPRMKTSSDDGAAADIGVICETKLQNKFNAASFLENTAFVDKPSSDIITVPIAANGKLKSLSFRTGSRKRIKDCKQNNQDSKVLGKPQQNSGTRKSVTDRTAIHHRHSKPLEAGNSKVRQQDMTGTGSRFVNVLRTPKTKAKASCTTSQATFAESHASGRYSIKTKDCHHKPPTPLSIYWHRIEPKPKAAYRYLKELRPFESPDFEDVVPGTSCLHDCFHSYDTSEEETHSDNQQPRFPELFNFHKLFTK